MTRAYVLDPVTRATLGLVDQSWERLAYTRRYVAMDTFELVINRSRLWASELAKNRLLYLPDEGDLVFLIEQIASTAEGSTRNDEMTVTGRSLEGIAMAERLVEPPAGESHDRVTAVAAETAIKHYLRANAADLAAAARQVPGLVVARDSVRGPDVTVAGRYQTVFDLVREIALLAGLGWEITYDPAGDDFVFDVTVGVDRSSSVFFDFAFETLERWEELDSVLDTKTVAVVAGQGEGTERDIATRWSGTEPTGFARREAFLDARDVELGEKTILDQRGDAFLAAAGAETRLEAGVHQYGAFRYRQHWDVGDIVLVRNAERALSYPARVVEVEKAFDRSAAAPTITATLGRPFPTLASRTQGSSARTADGGGPSLAGLAAGGDLAGTYPNPTVIDDSHDHTSATAHGVVDTAGPDANVTVDAPGAAGTPGTRSRAGHGHQLQTSSGTPTAVGIDSGASAGSTGAVARAGHAHQLTTSSALPARASIAGGAGTPGTVSRAAHAHPTTAPIRRVYTSSTTWTKPDNVAHIDVEVVGGGGGGGGAAATAAGESSCAGSGGGAGYARGLFTAAELSSLASASVTVGAAGSAGTAGNNSGGAGGTSSFAGTGITTISATGGGGGSGGAATSGNARSTGGGRGTGSGGDVNSMGSHGGGGTVIGGVPAVDSTGGASALGGGGRKESSSSGQAGGTFGGGGAGATNAGTNSARAGSPGAAGVVIVTEYFL